MKSVTTNAGNIKEDLEFPMIPQLVEKTWATLARNGQNKTQVTLSNKTVGAPVSRTTQHLSNKEKLYVKASLDLRLFVRLPQDHEWRKLSSAGIHEIIVQKLANSPSLFRKIKSVHSRFALSPNRTEARETIIKAGNSLLSGAKLEPATNWIPVIIPTVPSSIREMQGEIEASSSVIIDEVDRVCSIQLFHAKLYGGNKAEAPHRAWIVYFSKAPRVGFRIFDVSGIVRPLKKQQPLELYNLCNGHHPTISCSRAPSYGNCHLSSHTEEICMAATKCKNSGSPRSLDSRRFLAHPTRSGAPTKEKMMTYRQAGEKVYIAVLRAKTAEESAASAENVNIDLTRSQESDIDIYSNNIPASPIEYSTGGSLRL